MSLKLPAPHSTTAAVGISNSQSYHGRRLMQMLFRANASNNDEHNREEASDTSRQCAPNNSSKKLELMDPRAEEDTEDLQAITGSRFNGIATPRAQLPMPSVPPSKFHSLKRKLFPSRMRTAHPIRIPPLVTSPIAVSSADKALLRPSNNNNQRPPALEEPQLSTDEMRVDKESRVLKPNAEASGSLASLSCWDQVKVGRAIGDDDDLELVTAIENLDSAIEQDTLDEVDWLLHVAELCSREDTDLPEYVCFGSQMNRAIENLHKWRQCQEQEAQDAIRKLEQEDEDGANQRAAQQPIEEESQALENEYERKKHQWELEREAQTAHLRFVEESFQATIPKTTLDGDEVARVEQVLLESNRLESDANATSLASVGGASNSQTSRLRNEIFDLGVRELSSSIQATLLLELEGADSELDMKLYDVEAFTADLDSVLAQFSGENLRQLTTSDDL